MLMRQIKYFITVVDCNSFTEAAEELYISQSAISQQIQALEADLGVKLMEREKRQFSLTAAGEYFYQQGRLLLEEAEGLRRETVRVGQADETRLNVAYLRCYGGRELHLAIAAFSKLHPEMDIHIASGSHEELYDLIRFGSVDLVLSDQRRAFSNEYVNYELTECDLHVEISSRNKLSALPYITLDALKRFPCILIASSEHQETESEYYRKTLGFDGNFLFAENLEEGRLMVAGNRGFMPIGNVASLPLMDATIQRLPLLRGDKPLKRKYCVFWLKDKTSSYIESFADCLHEVFA